MSQISEAKIVFIRVHGALYSIQVVHRGDAPDWLDRAILGAVSKRRRISDVVHWFGLPRKLLEDAIVKLIEQNLIAIDVRSGHIESVGTAMPAPADATSEEIWVWQDRSTGTIVPWNRLKGLHRQEPETFGELEIRPIDYKSVPEMSDAELLTKLEAVEPSLADMARTIGCVSRGAIPIYVQALSPMGAKYVFDTSADTGVPWALARAWQRADLGVAASYAEDMGVRTLEGLVGDWRSAAESVLTNRDVASGAGERWRGLELAAGRVRHVLKASASAELSIWDPTAPSGPRVDERVDAAIAQARRRLVGFATTAKGLARSIARLRKTDVERVLVVPEGMNHEKMDDIEVKPSKFIEGKRDVEWLLIDDGDWWLLEGGMRTALFCRQAAPFASLLAMGELSAHPGSLRGPDDERETARLRVLSSIEEIHEEVVRAGRTHGAAGSHVAERARTSCERVAKLVNDLRPAPLALRSTSMTEILERSAATAQGDFVTVLLTSSDGALACGAKELERRNTSVDICLWMSETARRENWRAVGHPGVACMVATGELVAFGPDGDPGSEGEGWHEVYNPEMADMVRRLAHSAR